MWGTRQKAEPPGGRFVSAARRLGVLALAALLVPGVAAADGSIELRVRTRDTLVGGTVEIDEHVTITVKGERLRQEVRGTRSVLTRRGARYEKPGQRATIDQVDQGRRYEINLDAGTYVEESFARLRQQHEETIAAAEKALRLGPGDAPALAVSVDRTGERHQVNGQECQRVVLKSAREISVTMGRGAGAPMLSKFSMSFDLCLAAEGALTREARVIAERVADLTGARGPLLQRQLRIFEARRDVFAVFELMQHVLEREQQALGGVAMRWERVFVGPRRDDPQATLFLQSGEVTRIAETGVDPSALDLPSGLTLDPRSLPRKP